MNIFKVVTNKIYKLVLAIRLHSNGTIVLSLSLTTKMMKEGIENNVYIGKNTICEFPNSRIGKYTYINSGIIYNACIGRYCSIGYNVSIGAGKHFYNNVSTYPIKNRVLNIKNDDEFINEITDIGNDVWIGNNAVIMEGVKVGDGAVIGAGAIVTKDIPPYSIAVGIPAKTIKTRTSDLNIDFLEKLSWWNWTENDIKENSNLFHMNIDEFVKLQKEDNNSFCNRKG